MKRKRMTPRYDLPISSEETVWAVYDVFTGELVSYAVGVQFVPDGRVNIKPGDRVRVTVERLPQPRKGSLK
jgi:hypothetical protein